MNLYHVFAVSFELYRLKFDINEARVRAYRVVDSHGDNSFKSVWARFTKNWKA